ncbi:MAG: hypothetical protein LUG66_08550 [Clostridiales bacterium]|nr:hypothetical protein [Clostridiales bacterium]
MKKYDNNFLDENDIIDCLKRGCEVEFLYQSKKYSITHTLNDEISVTEYNNMASERTYKTAEEAMEYSFGDKLLRDIIGKMKIIDRSF